MKKIYVATSWKNKHTDEVISAIQAAGCAAYDFRQNGFQWRNVHKDFTGQSGVGLVGAKLYTDMLEHREAADAFMLDLRALEGADGLMLVLPCGRSAHTEFGWAVGRGLPTVVYSPELVSDLELMHSFSLPIFDDVKKAADELSRRVAGWRRNKKCKCKGFYIDPLCPGRGNHR